MVLERAIIFESLNDVGDEGEAQQDELIPE